MGNGYEYGVKSNLGVILVGSKIEKSEKKISPPLPSKTRCYLILPSLPNNHRKLIACHNLVKG